MVIESDARRKALQEHIFVESGLLLRLIGEIRKYYPKPRDLEGGNEDGSEEADGTDQAESEAGKGKSQSHPPTLGHFLNIAQAINITLANNLKMAPTILVQTRKMLLTKTTLKAKGIADVAKRTRLEI